LIVKANKVGPRHDSRMAFEERTALEFIADFAHDRTIERKPSKSP
jgi:hypothetical protein